MIGDGVEVRVLRVGRDGVRIGVTAPPAVVVHRREVYDQICHENRTAAASATAGVRLIERLRQTAVNPGPARPADVPSSPGADDARDA